MLTIVPKGLQSAAVASIVRFDRSNGRQGAAAHFATAVAELHSDDAIDRRRVSRLQRWRESFIPKMLRFNMPSSALAMLAGGTP